MKKFTEAKALNGVADFHRLFDLPVLDKPIVPSAERCALRISLLQEELDELREAIAQNDIVAAADAFADLQYVLSGAIHEFGLGEKFAELFDEVQSSNMSKACDSLEIAEESIEWYKREKDTEGFPVQKGDKYLIYRSSDKKVLKSIRYKAADFKAIVERE